MLDDVKRWMTPDGTEGGNARAELWRSLNAIGLRLLQKAEESKRHEEVPYQHTPAQSSKSSFKPAAGGNTELQPVPEEVLYQIQPGCSAPPTSHIPATRLG